jgi:hypothetical protein
MDEILCSWNVLRVMVAVINSPIVIAILSVSLGGLAASTLASNYQRKQQIFELRLQGLKTLLDVQASWLHANLSVLEAESHENYMRLLTTIRYVRVLFPGPDINERLKSYHDAAAELTKHFGQKGDSASIDAEDDAIAKLHFALNELTKVLVSRLGIRE